MNAKERIARRVAQELHDGDRVNLGIGLQTLVAQYLTPSVQVVFHSENGIMGMSPLPGEGFEDRNLTDAGGRPVALRRGLPVVMTMRTVTPPSPEPGRRSHLADPPRMG